VLKAAHPQIQESEDRLAAHAVTTQALQSKLKAVESVMARLSNIARCRQWCNKAKTERASANDDFVVSCLNKVVARTKELREHLQEVRTKHNTMLESLNVLEDAIARFPEMARQAVIQRITDDATDNNAMSTRKAGPCGGSVDSLWFLIQSIKCALRSAEAKEVNVPHDKCCTISESAEYLALLQPYADKNVALERVQRENRRLMEEVYKLTKLKAVMLK